VFGVGGRQRCDWKWVGKVVKSRRTWPPFPGLSALERGGGYLGLEPQAGIGRTFGAQTRRVANPIPNPAETHELR
jgi:hypothetical protein